MPSALCFYFGSIVAQISNGACPTERFSCGAGSSAMPDEEIGKMSPLFFWDNFHQIELNLDWIIIFCQTDSLAHPVNMGIDYNTRYSKGIS